MAGGIRIPPYRPLDVQTPAVPGGGYINVDASAGSFGPSPLLQFGLQAAEGVAGIAGVVAQQLARDDEAVVKDADARLGTTRAEVRDRAERCGWDSPLTEAALRQQTSRTLVSVIEAAVGRDPARARMLGARYAREYRPDLVRFDTQRTARFISSPRGRKQRKPAMIDERSTTVLLALYDALLGAIPGHLRSITARWDETSIHFDCYYDGEITEDDQEAMEIVESDLSTNFPVTHTVSHARHRLDFPGDFPDSGRFIFHRREDWPVFPQE